MQHRSVSQGLLEEFSYQEHQTYKSPSFHFPLPRTSALLNSELTMKEETFVLMNCRCCKKALFHTLLRIKMISLITNKKLVANVV